MGTWRGKGHGNATGWVATRMVKSEEAMCVCVCVCVCVLGAAARKSSGTRLFGTRARCDSEAEDEGRHGSGDTPPATIAPVPILPSEVRAKTVPHNASAGEAQPTETGV
ncbi:hypothetical protein TRVL_03396 [Trypanosoma vivax]|nr:hypothetical protein TRVL_03396 [Trypanosoma vivax]